MAQIGGLSNSASASGTSSIRGYGGLASGLDTDSLIENMTYATRSKIAAQKQKKESLQWKQTAIRSLTSKAYEFTNKYTSYASSSNLLSSKLFSRNNITALGANSKYISVSGSSTTADTFSVLGVKNLASNAQLSTLEDASDRQLVSGGLNADLAGTDIDVNLIAEKSIFIKYGTKLFSVKLDKAKNYDDASSTAASINEALKEVSIGDKKTLADVVKAGVGSDGKMEFKSLDTNGNTVALAGGTGDILKNLGFLNEGESISKLSDARTTITATGLSALNQAKFTENKSMAEHLAGKSISFSYNGNIKWIELGSAEELATLDGLKKDIQTKLDDAFGKGRISVTFDNDTGDPRQLVFETTIPKTVNGKVVAGEPDKTSVLSVTAADFGILGHYGVLGMEDGANNRLNLSSKALESGLTAERMSSAGIDASDPNQKMVLMINDQRFEFDKDASISDIISKVNEDREAGVTITYQSNTDRFVINSKGSGASGQVKIGAADAGSIDLGKLLFGDESSGDYRVAEGKDAVLSIKYAGTSEAVEISRGSNTFTVDGLNVTLKGAFGYTAAGLDPAAEEVTFDAQVDAENTAKIVQEMIDSFNEVIKLVNQEVNQKPDRDYHPLTDEQRENMSDSQIERWETEAKKGLLFNDTDVRGFADSLRFILPAADRAAFSKMGITVSTDYEDHGKLVLDEEKFKAALQSDPESVRLLFTKEKSVDEEGNELDGGLMVKMDTIMSKYAGMTGATKGILVERAGSVYAPTSILKNSLQKQIDEIDDYVDDLKDKLKMEQDRYISQFTKLETLISQMNSQSSSLSSMFSS